MRTFVYPIQKEPLRRAFDTVSKSSEAVKIWVCEDGEVKLARRGYRHHTYVGAFNKEIAYSDFLDEVFYAAEHEPLFRIGRIMRLINAGTNTISRIAFTMEESPGAVRSRLLVARDLGWIRPNRVGLKNAWELSLDETYLEAPNADG